MLAVHPARREDHTALCCLFDELDEFHRQARPDLFRPCKVIELDNLVVRADWRGRGIGERLLVETQRWSREQGASHVEVGVHAFNRGARRFYERYGFTRSKDRLMLVA